MKRWKFSETQIGSMVEQGGAGSAVKDQCR